VGIRLSITQKISRAAVAGALGLSTVVAPLAYAQSPSQATGTVTPTPAPKNGNDPTPPPLPAPRPMATPAPFGREEDQNLSPQVRVQRSAEHLDRMREVLKTVLKFLEEAREKRDVIKLNCVNEKLTAVKGLLKVSEQADVSMQEAIARRDEEMSRHEYDKISIARNKVDQLLGESEACVGELSIYAGETTVEVTGGDDQQTPFPTPVPGDIAVRPPAASPGENG